MLSHPRTRLKLPPWRYLQMPSIRRELARIIRYVRLEASRNFCLPGGADGQLLGRRRIIVVAMRTSHILDLLNVEDPSRGRVRFVTARGTRDTTFAHLWSLSLRMADAVHATIPKGC